MGMWTSVLGLCLDRWQLTTASAASCSLALPLESAPGLVNGAVKPQPVQIYSGPENTERHFLRKKKKLFLFFALLLIKLLETDVTNL